jgi:hypothetical protein
MNNASNTRPTLFKKSKTQIEEGKARGFLHLAFHAETAEERAEAWRKYEMHSADASKAFRWIK